MDEHILCIITKNIFLKTDRKQWRFFKDLNIMVSIKVIFLRRYSEADNIPGGHILNHVYFIFCMYAIILRETSYFTDYFIFYQSNILLFYYKVIYYSTIYYNFFSSLLQIFYLFFYSTILLSYCSTFLVYLF